jgi:putative exosortase-associated protein (TIGR04073 family)
MMKIFFLSGLFLLSAATLGLPTSVYAEEMEVQKTNCIAQQSYADKMEDKALNGITNIGTAILEMPKNTINTVNESNIVYGIVGGAIKGMLHTAGRMTAGLVDLATFWLPTEPILQPGKIWDDFDEETTYGKTFRVEKNLPPCNER